MPKAVNIGLASPYLTVPPRFSSPAHLLHNRPYQDALSLLIPRPAPSYSPYALVLPTHPRTGPSSLDYKKGHHGRFRRPREPHQACGLDHWRIRCVASDPWSASYIRSSNTWAIAVPKNVWLTNTRHQVTLDASSHITFTATSLLPHSA